MKNDHFSVARLQSCRLRIVSMVHQRMNTKKAQLRKRAVTLVIRVKKTKETRHQKKMY